MSGGVVDEFPATYRQAWHFRSMERGYSSVNVPLVVRLEASYEIGCVEAAVDDLVVRHEALRTRLVGRAGGVVQVVHAAGGVDLVRRAGRWSGTGAGRTAGVVEQVIAEPFDLRGGPLVRAALCEPDGESPVLVLSAHHAVCDGWSVGLLLRDLRELYRARRDGRSSDLPELEVALGDYALWEQSVDGGDVTGYWREALAGVDPRLSRGRRAHADGDAARIELVQLTTIEAATVRRLERLARERGTTVARAIGAAVLASLRGYLVGRVCVGWVTANRDRPELLDVVGELEDVLPVCVDVTGDPSVDELAARFGSALADAYDHQLPTGLVDRLVRDDVGRAVGPLVDVNINVLPHPPAEAGDGGADLDQVEPRREALRYELDRWWEGMGLMTYDLHRRADGSVDGYLIVNVNAVDGHAVDDLVRRWDGVLVELGASRRA